MHHIRSLAVERMLAVDCMLLLVVVYHKMVVVYHKMAVRILNCNLQLYIVVVRIIYLTVDVMHYYSSADIWLPF